MGLRPPSGASSGGGHAAWEASLKASSITLDDFCNALREVGLPLSTVQVGHHPRPFRALYVPNDCRTAGTLLRVTAEGIPPEIRTRYALLIAELQRKKCIAREEMASVSVALNQGT